MSEDALGRRIVRIGSAQARRAVDAVPTVVRESRHAIDALPDDVYARMRAQFSEVDATHLTFAVALMNALNRIAVGLRRGPAVKKS